MAAFVVREGFANTTLMMVTVKFFLGLMANIIYVWFTDWYSRRSADHVRRAKSVVMVKAKDQITACQI